MHDEWVVTPELFILPHEKDFLLYAPLRGSVSLINQAAAAWIATAMHQGKVTEIPSALNSLTNIGIIEPLDSSIPCSMDKAYKKQPFKPTGVIVLTTSFCNFRCVYCYASAASNHNQVDLDFAKAALRLVIANALEVGESTAHIAFHGGGEPTTAFSFIKECVTYARRQAKDKLEIVPSIVTNGYLSKKQVEWLGQNMASIQISLDGPASIQNIQRPLFNGSATFDRVVQSIHRFIEMGVPDLLIKSTISRPIVHFMPEIAHFLCKTFPLPRFHFGPVLEFGRSKQTGYGEPEVNSFIEYALEAQSIAASYGRQIVISGAQETFPNLRHEFCGLTEPNFAITIDGQISGCYEVLNASDLRSDRFHYGFYEDGQFHFDSQKIESLRQRQNTLAPKCHNCFARWQCAGDCQVRWYDEESGDYDDGTDFRCALNRALIKRALIQSVTHGTSSAVHLPAEWSPAHSFVD